MALKCLFLKLGESVQPLSSTPCPCHSSGSGFSASPSAYGVSVCIYFAHCSQFQVWKAELDPMIPLPKY